ncbi:MAG: futalosine hydrolase [Desulforhopalus sp.]|nr:futalosine hydrolase [Desulforhopalus sp.]
MILVVAATEIEMAPFLAQSAELPGGDCTCRTLITGVGPVETALRLTRFLCESGEQFDAVIHFGVGGAYILPEKSRQPELLDICLAEHEVAGDFGICLGESMEYLDTTLTGEIVYKMDGSLLKRCRTIFDRLGTNYHPGVFITVNGITGTSTRGEILQSRWNGLCENMEGASVARVCREFNLPCAELRCISNYVEDRNPSTWRLQEACLKAAHTAIQLVKGLTI